MNKFQLQEEQLAELHKTFARAKKKSAKDAYKINVIILLATGWTIETISAALLISDETIRQYKTAYTHYTSRCETWLNQCLKVISNS